MNREMHPSQLKARERQIALEAAARDQKMAAERARVESLPPDMRQLYDRGQGAAFGAGLVRRGIFPHDTTQAVHSVVAFLQSMYEHYCVLLAAHPRFAEFFPDAAMAMAKEQAARGPQIALVGADGRPLSSTGDLEPTDAERCPSCGSLEFQVQTIGWVDQPGHVHDPNMRQCGCGTGWYPLCPACRWNAPDAAAEQVQPDAQVVEQHAENIAEHIMQNGTGERPALMLMHPDTGKALWPEDAAAIDAALEQAPEPGLESDTAEQRDPAVNHGQD